MLDVYETKDERFVFFTCISVNPVPKLKQDICPVLVRILREPVPSMLRHRIAGVVSLEREERLMHIGSDAELKYYIKRIAAEELFEGDLQNEVTLEIYDPGEKLMVAGEPLRSFMILVEGTTRICAVSEEGKQVLVAEAVPPQMLGDIEFMDNEKTLHSVFAKDRVKTITISARALEEKFADSLNFYRFICANLMRKLYETSGAYSGSLLYDAKTRLINYLLSQGRDGEEFAFPVEITAELLGITSRHLSRLITELCELGAIERRPHRSLRILDREKLEKSRH